MTAAAAAAAAAAATLGCRQFDKPPSAPSMHGFGVCAAKEQRVPVGALCESLCLHLSFLPLLDNGAAPPTAPHAAACDSYMRGVAKALLVSLFGRPLESASLRCFLARGHLF